MAKLLAALFQKNSKHIRVNYLKKVKRVNSIETSS